MPAPVDPLAVAQQRYAEAQAAMAEAKASVDKLSAVGGEIRGNEVQHNIPPGVQSFMSMVGPPTQQYPAPSQATAHLEDLLRARDALLARHQREQAYMEDLLRKRDALLSSRGPNAPLAPGEIDMGSGPGRPAPVAPAPAPAAPLNLGPALPQGDTHGGGGMTKIVN